MHHSVNLVAGSERDALGIIQTSGSLELLASPELRKLKNRFSKRVLGSQNQESARKLASNNSKLEIADDGEIIYQGDVNNLDAIFPSDGVIRIKQRPPKIKGDS